MKEKIKNIIIIILILIIFGLIGYIVYERIKKEDTNKVETTTTTTQTTTNKFDISFKEETKEHRNNNGILIFTNKRSIPITNSNDEIQKNIVKNLKILIDKVWDENNTSAQEYATTAYENATEDIKDLGVEYNCYLEYKNEEVLTVICDMSGGLGGVSWNATDGYTFNLKTGELLEVTNLTNSSDALINNVYTYVEDYLIKNHGEEYLFEDWKESLKDSLFKTTNWYFTETTLNIVLDKYLVADGATGVIIVEIPYDEINDYMKEEYKI